MYKIELKKDSVTVWTSRPLAMSEHVAIIMVMRDVPLHVRFDEIKITKEV
jgi:hypothetical protein